MTTTSEILLATNPDNPVIIGSLSQTKTAELRTEDKAKQLPRPSGYRILCAIPDVEKEFESGLVKIGRAHV